MFICLLNRLPMERITVQHKQYLWELRFFRWSIRDLSSCQLHVKNFYYRKISIGYYCAQVQCQALIANESRPILGLARLQMVRTRTRCEMEVDRIDRQFDVSCQVSNSNPFATSKRSACCSTFFFFRFTKRSFYIRCRSFLSNSMQVISPVLPIQLQESITITILCPIMGISPLFLGGWCCSQFMWNTKSISNTNCNLQKIQICMQ